MSAQKSNGPIIDPALCRCCRAIKKCRVLTAEYNWMGKKEVYADMVMDCYGILLSHVDDNEKDSGVCATCVVRLREALAFRRQVLQCEELFLQAKMAPPEEETNINYESKLKKLELDTIELKTEPKDYNSDHHSDMDHTDDGAVPTYSDDEDNKPLKPDSKPVEPPLKDEDLKSEESEDFGSSSDSDEPIKKKAKRKTKGKANGAKKKSPKAGKKQKADSETEHLLTEEIHIKMELSEDEMSDEDFFDVPIELDFTDMPEETKKRRWVRDRSDGLSDYDLLDSEANDKIFFEHLNMSKSSFENLHVMVEQQIEKADTAMRKSISTRERLAICLRYFHTGLSYKTLSKKYRVGHSTVSEIVKDCSRALWSVLQPVYMPAPRESTWRETEKGFREKWDFPNCVGSIGGKHIIAKSRQHLGPDIEYPKVSDRPCHRRLVTIALLAVMDHNNKILAIDIGNYAKDGNHNIVENSRFYNKYMDGKKFLPNKPLPGDSVPCPFVLVSGGTFTIKYNLLRPFPKAPNYDASRKVFNQYLSRVCTAETTFEFLIETWAVLKRPMETKIETAVAVMKAICCLHNYTLAEHGIMHNLYPKPGCWSKRPTKKKLKGIMPFKPTNHRSNNAALATRETFLAYFNRLGPLEPIDDQNESINDQNEVASVSDLTIGHFMDHIRTDDANKEEFTQEKKYDKENDPLQEQIKPENTEEGSSESLIVPVEMQGEPSSSVSETVKCIKKPNCSVKETVELQDPNEVFVNDEFDSNSFHEAVACIEKPIDSVKKTVELLEPKEIGS